MRRFLALILAAQQMACSRPAPFESVESLVDSPGRLRELRAACKFDRKRVGETQCYAVEEATRRRFFGSGGPKHTPEPLPPASAAPAPGEVR
jgi:hypothetical protein